MSQEQQHQHQQQVMSCQQQQQQLEQMQQQQFLQQHQQQQQQLMQQLQQFQLQPLMQKDQQLQQQPQQISQQKQQQQQQQHKQHTKKKKKLLLPQQRQQQRQQRQQRQSEQPLQQQQQQNLMILQQQQQQQQQWMQQQQQLMQQQFMQQQMWQQQQLGIQPTTQQAMAAGVPVPVGGWSMPTSTASTALSNAALQNTAPLIPCWLSGQGQQPQWPFQSAALVSNQTLLAGAAPSASASFQSSLGPSVQGQSIGAAASAVHAADAAATGSARSTKQPASKGSRKVCVGRQLLTRSKSATSTASVRASALAARLTWAKRAPPKSVVRNGSVETHAPAQQRLPRGQDGSAGSKLGSKVPVTKTPPSTIRQRSSTQRPQSPQVPAQRAPRASARVEKPKNGAGLVKAGKGTPKLAIVDSTATRPKAKLRQVRAVVAHRPSDLLAKLAEAASRYERRPNAARVLRADSQPGSPAASIEDEGAGEISAASSPLGLEAASDAEAASFGASAAEVLSTAEGDGRGGGNGCGPCGCGIAGVWDNLTLLGESCTAEVLKKLFQQHL